MYNASFFQYFVDNDIILTNSYIDDESMLSFNHAKIKVKFAQRKLSLSQSTNLNIDDYEKILQLNESTQNS